MSVDGSLSEVRFGSEADAAGIAIKTTPQAESSAGCRYGAACSSMQSTRSG